MTVSVQQAQSTLAELIRTGKPAERILIEENGRTVAELVVRSRPQRREAGFLKGKIHFIGPDDDSHLDDFKEYME